ncbi:MAG: sulfite exporter TauE/SafE family protein [Candidatus Hodarchaeales archaeon]|jgi:uncharacterized membrane protein YfcA
MDITLYLILIITGFFIGILSAMVGIGGGLVTVPILIFFFNQTPDVATAISTVVIIFTSSTGAFTYYRQKRIDLRTGGFFALIVIPSAFIGGKITEYLDANVFVLIFGLLMIFVALRKIFLDINSSKSSSQSNSEVTTNTETESKYGLIPQDTEKRILVDNSGKVFHYNVKVRKALIGALFGGFIGGLLGVGGGVIFVPVLTSLAGLPAHIAVATSTFTIVFSSTSASIAKISSGLVLYDYVFALGIGTVFGARLGALKVGKISSKNLLNIFYAIVILAGIRSILSAFGLF